MGPEQTSATTVPMLDADQVRQLAPMPAVVKAVRAAFEAYGRGEFDTPHYWEAEEGAYVIKAVVHLPTQTMAVKTLTVNPERRPLVRGVVSFLDRANGQEIVADAGAVTSLRTGAIVGVATDLLAKLGAARLVLIGAGAQAADQFRAVAAVRRVSSLTVVDIDHGRAQALLQDLRTDLRGITTSIASSPREAVRDADIVCCATSSREPLFELTDLPDEVHVNAIGSFRPEMRELPSELMATATVVVDDLEACRLESGEVVEALRSGRLVEDDITTLSAALSQPPQAASRTVFKTVGIAVEDWAVMAALATARHQTVL